MDAEYRPLTLDDYEQANDLESVAFYNRPRPEVLDRMKQFFPPEWTLGAFVDGRLVADVRTIPMARRLNGRATPLGAVGPVVCAAAYRRQGHIGRLLRLALEDMRSRGIALSGLHTPHDALYRRYGWERAEGKRRYVFRAKDLQLRFRGRRGATEAVTADGWQQLEEVYREYAGPRNGPLHRVEPWWRHVVLEDWESKPRDAVLWRSPEGRPEGYVIYGPQPSATDPRRHDLMVQDMVSVSADAYLGLWEHLATHDIALNLMVDRALDDPFPDLLEDPWRIEFQRAEGAMIRIVDVERALSMRPYAGQRPVSLTMRISDATAPWNDGVWQIEAADGRMQAARQEDGEADVELSVNFLAPLFTGHLRAATAAATGMLRVHNPPAVAALAEAFAVTFPPYCNDWY